jgi:hypothetical protein
MFTCSLFGLGNPEEGFDITRAYREQARLLKIPGYVLKYADVPLPGKQYYDYLEGRINMEKTFSDTKNALRTLLVTKVVKETTLYPNLPIFPLTILFVGCLCVIPLFTKVFTSVFSTHRLYIPKVIKTVPQPAVLKLVNTIQFTKVVDFLASKNSIAKMYTLEKRLSENFFHNLLVKNKFSSIFSSVEMKNFCTFDLSIDCVTTIFANNSKVYGKVMLFDRSCYNYYPNTEIEYLFQEFFFEVRLKNNFIFEDVFSCNGNLMFESNSIKLGECVNQKRIPLEKPNVLNLHNINDVNSEINRIINSIDLFPDNSKPYKIPAFFRTALEYDYVNYIRNSAASLNHQIRGLPLFGTLPEELSTIYRAPLTKKLFGHGHPYYSSIIAKRCVDLDNIVINKILKSFVTEEY